jgi:hypothetical protein
VVFPEGVSQSDLEDRKLRNRIVNEHQDRLKEGGDWVIYPLTLQMISEGRFALDDTGGVYLDGELIPKGFRL